MSIFLAPDDVAILTGKKKKSCQVDQLRFMGIPFYINAAGRPVVTKAALNCLETECDLPKKEWESAVLK